MNIRFKTVCWSVLIGFNSYIAAVNVNQIKNPWGSAGLKLRRQFSFIGDRIPVMPPNSPDKITLKFD